MSWAPATLAMLAYSCFVGDRWRIGASALDRDCRCGLTLTLGVNAKLGCDEVVAGPSEILLDQSDLTSELVGIPLGKPGALSLESGSSLGFLMLVRPRSLRGSHVPP
jgi:hypothetical protein